MKPTEDIFTHTNTLMVHSHILECPETKQHKNEGTSRASTPHVLDESFK